MDFSTAAAANAPIERDKTLGAMSGGNNGGCDREKVGGSKGETKGTTTLVVGQLSKVVCLVVLFVLCVCLCWTIAALERRICQLEKDNERRGDEVRPFIM